MEEKQRDKLKKVKKKGLVPKSVRSEEKLPSKKVKQPYPNLNLSINHTYCNS
jgi:hypothetical protein